MVYFSEKIKQACFREFLRPLTPWSRWMENTFTFFLVRNELKTTLICTLVCLASLQRVKRFFLEVAIFSRWPNREQLCFQTSKWKLCIISWTKRWCRILSTYIRGRINYIARKHYRDTDVIYRENHLKVLIIFLPNQNP